MIHWQDAGGMMGNRVDLESLLSPQIIPELKDDVFAPPPAHKARRSMMIQSRQRLKQGSTSGQLSTQGSLAPMDSVDGIPNAGFNFQNGPSLSSTSLNLADLQSFLYDRPNRGDEIRKSRVDPELQCFSFEHPLGELKRDDKGNYIRSYSQLEDMRLDPNKGPIQVKAINIKIKDNAVLHHTDQYADTHILKSPHLIVRRGQKFTIDLQFSIDFRPQFDKIQLLLEIGECPLESRGTRIDIPVFEGEVDKDLSKDPGNAWAMIQFTQPSAATLEVYLGDDTIVGAWKFKVVTMLKSSSEKKQDLITFARECFSRKRMRYIYPAAIVYVLFNPWCKDDQVYMQDEEEIKEYVLADVGKIWRGSHNSPEANPWVYGQFESGILTSSLAILHHSRLPLPLRSSPIQVTRAIAAMISSPDLECVVQERWVPDFTGGVDPTSWTGSTAILRRYLLTRNPVPYGQSWVFAGVLTSICRCLGIPTRTVTAYSTAHDSETTTTIDIHFDIEGRPIEHLNTDSIWTYHVWSECWMERPDLPDGYSGWQVLDGTPQEKCEGVDNAGPTPLNAVLKGQVGLGYDTALVFAELNADIVYWLYTDVGVKYIRKEEEKIGQLMSTRNPSVGLAEETDDRMDITKLYRDKPGTSDKIVKMMEKLFNSASHKAIAFQAMSPQATEDVRFTMDLSGIKPMGAPWQAKIKMRNKADSLRTIHLSLRVEAIQYYGARPKKVKMTRATVRLDPKCETEIAVEVLLRDYIERILDQSVFKVTLLCHIDETGQIYATGDDCKLEMPVIKIFTSPSPKINQKMTVKLELSNPIPVQLSNCRFTLEGPGLCNPTVIPCKSVMPNGVIEAETQIKPMLKGQKYLVARFNSSSLNDCCGLACVNIGA